MPINALPHEILIKIFKVVMEGGLTPISRSGIVKGYITPALDECDSPINLIGTCHDWEAIILSTPSLWPKSIAGIIGDVFFTPEYIEIYLQASGGSRFDLALYPDKGAEIVDLTHNKATVGILDVFSRHSDQWNSLCIKLNTVEVINKFVNILQEKAPKSPLRKLEVLLYADHLPYDTLQALLSSIALFPSLDHYAWISDSLQFYRVGIPRELSWNSLQVLYVDADIPFEDFVWCFQKCTSATDVTFLTAFQSSELDLGFIAEIAVLPRLTSLTINKYCRPYELVNYFRFYSLTSLKIIGLELQIDGPPDSNILEIFFLASRCPLLKFEVDDTSFNSMVDQEIVECLRTPYLQSVADVCITVSQLPGYWERVMNWLGPGSRNPLGITTWTDDSGHHIGWRKDRD